MFVLLPLRRTAGVALAMLALWSGFSACRPRAAAPLPPLRVAIDLWPGYYPLVIAEARGYLAEENVRVEMLFPQDTHRMIADFAARKHDAICVSIGDIILTTRVQPDVRMILNSDESAGGDQLLGREPFRDAAQIRGKRIGTTLGGFGELFVRRFLQRHGVPLDAVTLVNADAAQMPELLRRGELDLGNTWEPYAAEARAAGFLPWFTSLDTPGLILDGMIMHEPVMRARAPQVRGLVRAWFRAVEWWRAHESEGNLLCEQRLKLPAGSVSLTGIRLLDRAENRRAFTPGTPGSLHEATREYVEFFIARGALSQRVQPDELLDPRFIE